MKDLSEIIKSILFVAGEAIEYTDIASKLWVSEEEVKAAVESIKQQAEYENTGIQVVTFKNKAQLCSNPKYAALVSQVLNPIKEQALTRAVLETAAIIAYKQPITRLEVEQVRGVNCDYTINTLIENKLIEVAGRKDAVGMPMLYSTTDEFLKRFGLNDINDLPDYEELLQRIEVIHNPNKSLFDMQSAEAISTEQEEQIGLEDMREEEVNDVVADLLNAMNDEEEKASNE